MKTKNAASTDRRQKRFVAYYYCNGCCLSLGVSICFQSPNVEIHLPFGFIRIGWSHDLPGDRGIGKQLGHKFLYRAWGYV